jgi:NADH dehydrogenase
LLRNHLISVLVAAEVEEDPARKRELLTFVVVGGGYTGVEVAAEINGFTREAAKSYRRVDPGDVTVVLVQGRDRILPELAPSLADFSHRLLEKRGIGIRLGTRITGATANAVMLTDGTTVRARTLVAAIGSAPSRLLDTISVPRDDRGRIEVDAILAVPGLRHVWAAGDCAAIPDLRRGGTCPPTAQYALREGRAVARNVLASISGDEPRQFTHRNLGVFVPLGRFSAAAEVLGLKLSGFLAWWLYRTYYHSQLPRLDRKLRVVFDWSLELIFRRGIVQMDVTSSEAISRGHYEPGDVVFRQGEIAGSFYVIVGGSVQIYREEDGRETEVATLGPGEYFGEMSLLEGVTHTALARARSPVDLLIMGGAEFKALAGSSTHFGELLAQVMRRRERGNATEGDSTGCEQGGSE